MSWMVLIMLFSSSISVNQGFNFEREPDLASTQRFTDDKEAFCPVKADRGLDLWGGCDKKRVRLLDCSPVFIFISTSIYGGVSDQMRSLITLSRVSWGHPLLITPGRLQFMNQFSSAAGFLGSNAMAWRLDQAASLERTINLPVPGACRSVGSRNRIRSNRSMTAFYRARTEICVTGVRAKHKPGGKEPRSEGR